MLGIAYSGRESTIDTGIWVSYLKITEHMTTIKLAKANLKDKGILH
jgi:hypothetical protein